MVGHTECRWKQIIFTAYALSQGKGDDRVMMMTLGPEAVHEYLQPMAAWDPEKYRFCTVGGEE